MSRTKRIFAGMIVVASALCLAPGISTADHHCSRYPLAPPTQTLPPTAVISSGYFGVGGIGALDSHGCVAGQQVADTRVLLPAADFVLLVLARANCTAGSTISSGSLSGLGVSASGITMTCQHDLGGVYTQLGIPNKSAYVSGIYPVSGTGTISGSATLGSTTYSTQSSKLV